MRFLFRVSRTCHKYVGLLFLLYFLLMGISGVLLNHPSLLHSVSVSHRLVPDSHGLSGGRRMAVRDIVVAGKLLFIAGRAGVWHSRDGGLSFRPLDRGFPASAYDRDTHALFYDHRHERLFAGTGRGLYCYNFATANWTALARGTVASQPVVDLLRIDNRLLAVTRSGIYSTGLGPADPAFRREKLRFDQHRPDRVSLLSFLLKLHDGSLFGSGGRLAVDLIGLVLIFLTVSGLIYWLFPHGRRLKIRFKGSGLRKWCYRHHLDIGFYAAVFLAVTTLSGMLIRPPFVALISSGRLPAWALPLEQGSGLWQPRIDKALYDETADTIWLATRNGFFSGRPDFSEPLGKRALPVPVSAMGTNVFAQLSGGRLLIGSFRGLYTWSAEDGAVQSLNPLTHRSGTRFRPLMATAALPDRTSPAMAVDYRRGLVSLNGATALSSSRLRLPDEWSEASMSLWHYLFEFHNGRIFRQWLGPYTWLLVPCGGSLLLLSLITGVHDWLWHRQKIRLKS